MSKTLRNSRLSLYVKEKNKKWLEKNAAKQGKSQSLLLDELLEEAKKNASYRKKS